MAGSPSQQFQEEYPNDAACLARIMEIQYGGDVNGLPGLRTKRMQFHPMGKRRAYACQGCGHHIYPALAPSFTRAVPSSRYGSLRCTS